MREKGMEFGDFGKGGGGLVSGNLSVSTNRSEKYQESPFFATTPE